MFFFFTSRRRHTRLQGDWSSDVCSSDLLGLPEAIARDQRARRAVAIVGLRKKAAKERPHAERRKEVPRNLRCCQSLRLAATDQVDRVSTEVRADALERSARPRPVAIVRR